jgi:glycosyltransferase involved in cell wall biosynthesis
MRVAIVHDYIKEYGGAERVLEALHEIWPKAPVFTTVYLPKYLGPHRKRFKDWEIRTSFLQYFPFKAKLISPFRLIAPLVFKTLDFSQFDLVIVSATGAYTPNIIRKSSALQICYCHTPPRYLYGYATARNWQRNPVFKFLGEVANHFLRQIDFKSAQNPDYFIANSQEVAGRIKKFFRREATVIYPPVNFPAIRYARGASFAYSLPATRGYFLAGGRLARPKRVDLAVAACTKLKLPLIVFGKEFAGYGEELRKLAGTNIDFVGEVTDEAKFKLMAGAKAFIFPSEDEDFGITPVEAMSVGTPVIAYRSGGVVESVVEGKTGVFFDQPSMDSLIGAIKRFEKLNIKPEDCLVRARKFSRERFKKEMVKFIEDVRKNKN